jgi:hypothetical protein
MRTHELHSERPATVIRLSLIAPHQRLRDICLRVTSYTTLIPNFTLIIPPKYPLLVPEVPQPATEFNKWPAAH